MTVAPTRFPRTLEDRPIVLPEGLTFASLKLQRLSDTVLSLDYEVFLRVWIASSFPADLLYAAKTAAIVDFIGRWYVECERASGAGSHDLDKLITSIMKDNKDVCILPR